MNTSLRLSTSIAALVALAACERPAPMTDELQRDLEQASSASVELAPQARSTAVVSAIELGESATPALPKTSPVRAPERAKAPTPKPAPVRRVAVAEPTPEREPTPVAETPAPVADAPAPAPTSEPEPPVLSEPSRQPVLTSPIPSTSRAPQGRAPARGGRGGGWWGTADVIRNAPFPVNP